MVLLFSNYGGNVKSMIKLKFVKAQNSNLLEYDELNKTDLMSELSIIQFKSPSKLLCKKIFRRILENETH